MCEIVTSPGGYWRRPVHLPPSDRTDHLAGKGCLMLYAGLGQRTSTIVIIAALGTIKNGARWAKKLSKNWFPSIRERSRLSRPRISLPACNQTTVIHELIIAEQVWTRRRLREKVGFTGSLRHRGVRLIAIGQSDIRLRNWVACAFREPGRWCRVMRTRVERSLEPGEIHRTDHAHLERMQ